MKALVAMSGGVDSSVTAYLLKKQGYGVTGLSFELWDERDTKNPNICCSVETIEIAKEVARKLGIEHYTVDVRDDFYRYIIEVFCTSYISGITPNPCILCNKFIKFKYLLIKAREIGADVIATGHYAKTAKPLRTVQELQGTEHKAHSVENHRFLLKKGADSKKDQSYVLYMMTQEELSKTVFPLGELKKDETKRIAQELGLASAIRPESQEICFIGNRNYVDFLRDFAPDALKPGPIVTTKGKIIGEHQGVALYTIGQRKRLGIRSLSPFYVCGIDRQNNTVTVGTREDAAQKIFKVKDLNWISLESLSKPLKATVKIRSTMRDEPATIIPFNNHGVIVELRSSQWAPAPGQSAVFYDGDLVIGGGIIE